MSVVAVLWVSYYHSAAHFLLNFRGMCNSVWVSLTTQPVQFHCTDAFLHAKNINIKCHILYLGRTGMYPPKTFTWPYKYLHNIQWYQARNQEKIPEYLNIGYIAPKNLCGPSQHPYGPSLVVDHHFTAVIMIGIIFSHQIL